ncbi:MAG: hypothetical protein KJ067_23175 [Vicinamibacteria bacterium]|nr:hypothetical protein [Vicinamibacteria bacterium]
MRVLITAGPHQGQVLDMGTAQAAAALRDGWAVVPLPEGEPMVAHHDQVIPVPPAEAAKTSLMALGADGVDEALSGAARSLEAIADLAGLEVPEVDRTLEDAVEAERELATERDGTPVPTKRRKRG